MESCNLQTTAHLAVSVAVKRLMQFSTLMVVCTHTKWIEHPRDKHTENLEIQESNINS